MSQHGSSTSTRATLYRALAGQLQTRGVRGEPLDAKTVQQRKGLRPLREAGNRVPKQPKLPHRYRIRYFGGGTRIGSWHIKPFWRHY